MFVTSRSFKKVLPAIIAIAGLMTSPALDARQFSGPILGYVTDPISSTLRVINGIPGASAIGGAVGADLKTRAALVSLEHDYALAVRDDSAEVVLITNLSGAPSAASISGVYAGGDALALSPDGTSAAVYSAVSARIQVIVGLPSNPAVGFEVDTVPMGPGLSALAINTDERLLAAFSQDENGMLYWFDATTAGRPIATVGKVSGIAFPVDGDRAVIADRAWNEVILFEDLSTSATPIRLANSVDGISDPLGILLSDDATTAYIANAGSRTVTMVNLAGGAAREIACECEPTGMRLLQGKFVFALTERTDKPLVLFDGGSTDPHLLVVPADIQTQN